MRINVLPECGGVNENGPHVLRYLKPWSLGGRTVWEGLESVGIEVSVLLGVAF